MYFFYIICVFGGVFFVIGVLIMVYNFWMIVCYGEVEEVDVVLVGFLVLVE